MGEKQASVAAGVSRLERLATVSVYLVLGYVLNLLFFFPIGDRYLNVLLLTAILSCLAYRKALSNWSPGSTGALAIPMSLYTLVLAISYLVNDGYESTIRMFLGGSLFLYAAAVVRLRVRYLVVLCVLAALEMAALIACDCSWQAFGRLGGFTNPIFLGMYSLCMALLCTYLAFAVAGRLQRCLLYISAVSFCVAAGLTQTRGVMVALLPLLLILAVYLYRHQLFSARRALLTLTAVVLVSGVTAFETGVYKRFIDMAPVLTDTIDLAEAEPAVSSAGFRLLMWRYALEVAREHPLFGAGKQRFQRYKAEWIEQGRFPAELVGYLPHAHAHNQYLQDLAMRGLIGLAALLALFILPGIKSLGIIRRSPEHDWAGYLALSLVVAYATFSLTEVALKHPEKIAVFTMIGFIAFNLAQRAVESAEGRST